MKSNFVRTFIRGLIFIIPILGLYFIFNSLYDLVSPYMKKLMERFGLENQFQLFFVVIISLAVIVLALYLLGRLTLTKPIVAMLDRLDNELQGISETYRKLKLNLDNTTSFMLEDRPPIYVAFGNSERPGFLIERREDLDKAIVFIPKNFNDFNGNIYIVPLSDVRLADTSAVDFIDALNHLGDGLNLKTKEV